MVEYYRKVIPTTDFKEKNDTDKIKIAYVFFPYSSCLLALNRIDDAITVVD